MKKLIIGLLIVILCMIPINAQTPEPPQPENVALMNKVNQEHSNTRKFFSDELTRQRNEFYKQMDDRAEYYEKTVDSLLTTMVWKLGLLWGGIVFFIVAFNNVIRNRLEKKRFKKLKESLKGEVLRDMMLHDSNKMQKQVKKPVFKSKKGFDVETDELFNPENVMPVPPAPPKKSWVERRQEKVREKKMQKFMKQKQKQEEVMRLRELQLKAKLGLPIEQPPQQPMPQQQPQQQPQPQQAPAPKPKPKADVEYSNTFEVEY